MRASDADAEAADSARTAHAGSLPTATPAASLSAANAPAPALPVPPVIVDGMQTPSTAMDALLGQTVAQLQGSASSSEASDGPDAAHAARKTSAPSPAGDAPAHEPQRITLRELNADTVQATLRDAQLGAQASMLAARGLHHALMEAGYARIRVVVNGKSVKSDGAPGDAAATDAPQAFRPSTPTDHKV